MRRAARKRDWAEIRAGRRNEEDSKEWGWG
jgi:hypothetical protein